MAYQNFYTTRLSSDIDASTATIGVETVPDPGVTSGHIVIEARNSTQREIISFTGVAGSTLTGCTRGVGGTTAKTHLKNALVEMNLVADDLQDILDAFASFSADNNDWRDLVGAGSLAATNGNRSSNFQVANDQTAILSKGMRLRIPRTGTAAPTMNATLNGTSQYFSKATPVGITFTDDFVVSAWIKVSTNPAATATVVSRYNGTSGWKLDILTDGTVRLVGHNAGVANYSLVQSVSAIPLGQWVHVTAQLDMSAFTATTTTSYIMFDGIDIPATVSRAGTNPTSLVQAGDFQIGAGNSTAFYGGKVAQAAVYGAKVTQATIRDRMNQTLLGSETSIVTAHTLSNSLTDLTANANNLTANGGAVTTDVDSPFNAYAYAIITSTPVFSAGNTTFTVQTPAGYPIPNQALGTISYSAVKVPFGFPAEADKWEVQLAKYITALTDSTASASIVKFSGSATMSLPTGSWNIKMSGSLRVSLTSLTSGFATVAVSNATNTQAYDDLVASNYTGLSTSGAATHYSNTSVAKAQVVTITAVTPLYLTLHKTNSASASAIIAENDEAFLIKAQCEYL